MGCENRCCVRKCFLGKVLSAERGNCCGLRILDWGMRRRRKRDNGDLTRNLLLVVLRRQGSDSILPIGEKCVAPLADGQGFDGFLAKSKVVQVRRRIQVAPIRYCAVDVGVGLLVTHSVSCWLVIADVLFVGLNIRRLGLDCLPIGGTRGCSRKSPSQFS